MTRVPVSATAMFAPVMPISALRNFVRSLPRANFTSLGISGGWPCFNLFAENVGDLFFGHVNRRHDHVRGRLPGELNDPLAEIGLADFDAGFLEERIEVNLLRRHRL